MLTKLFDFELPPELVAVRPAVPRDSARLMVVHADGQLEHRSFSELPQILKRGDMLAVNDSRVIRARLLGVRLPRVAGNPPAAFEATLHRRLDANLFRAFVLHARRLQPGDDVKFSGDLHARVMARRGREVDIAFAKSGAPLDQAIEHTGSMPLPPYIAKQRPSDIQDSTDYQTVYAKNDGSVAAPTAGLHFTEKLLERLAQAGIGRADLTLHVGAGTFLPVAAADTEDHVMHFEKVELKPDAAARLNRVHDAGGRIVAVGTTSLRTLESAAGDDGRLDAFAAETGIFITPGYRFKVVDMLVTNFHLPCSTLFMLVSAFCGLDTMRHAYAEAIAHRYRFYSYGDACLLIRPS